MINNYKKLNIIKPPYICPKETNGHLSQFSKKYFLKKINNLNYKYGYNSLFNKKINSFVRYSKYNYCNMIGNLIFLNGRNQIKISFEKKSFSIFFNENETLENLCSKIFGINEKVQTVEFFQENSQQPIQDSEKSKLFLKNFINQSFIIRINKNISSTYIPGIFPELFNETDLVKELSKSESDYNSNAEHIKNMVLLNLYKLKEKIQDEDLYNKEKEGFIQNISKKLEKRQQYIESLYKKQVSAEKIVKNKLIFKSKMAVATGVIFTVTHLSVFYALIYQIYAWDVIEPITYIVGNIYWIIGLGFLTFSNRKLEFELFQYKSISEIYSLKYAKRLGYSEEEKNILLEELNNIKILKEGIDDIL